MKKRTLATLLVVSMCASMLAGCGSNNSSSNSSDSNTNTEAAAPEDEDESEAAPAENNADSSGSGLTYGFVSKTTADPMFVGTYDGFEEACKELGIECVYRGTDDASAEKEIEIINQFISQGVDGIAVIAADEDALQPVLKQAMDAGIHVVTVDSATNAESRELHVDFADPVEMGRGMLRSAAKACNSEGQITILNGDPRVSLFADFETGIFAEYDENPDLYGKIDLVKEVAYGYDLPDQSTTEAQALIKNYPDTDVIICPTTVAILAAAKIIQDGNLDIKVTGIGLPSEMVSYYDNGICEEMWLWDIYEYGYLTAYSLTALVNGEITGAAGDTVEAGKLGSYTVETREVDGGTMIMMGDGLVFDSNNIKEWSEKL